MECGDATKSIEYKQSGIEIVDIELLRIADSDTSHALLTRSSITIIFTDAERREWRSRRLAKGTATATRNQQ